METCNPFEVLAQNLSHLSPAFVKVLNEDFSSYLRIPKEILGKAQEAFANREIISIVGPNGKFDISCKISGEAVVLEEGWAEFSRAHHLCNADKLMFLCVFPGLLMVFIHDKNDKCVRKHFGPGGLEHKREARNEKESQSQDKKGKVTASSSRHPGNRKDPCKPSEVPPDRPKVITISSDSSDNDAAGNGNTSTVQKSIVKGEISHTSDDSSEDETHYWPIMEVRLRKAFCSHRRVVKNEEQRMALRAAEKFKSSMPHFIKQMKTNNVYKDFTFIVPTKFASANLPEESTKISLRVPDRVEKWNTTCTFGVQNAGRQKVWRITGGWWRFSFDNNLEEGDTLVFEMKKKDPIKMNVHIFRVVKEIKPLEVI